MNERRQRCAAKLVIHNVDCSQQCMYGADEAQRRRPSFRQWFSTAPQHPPPAQHATLPRPAPVPRQASSSDREQHRANYAPGAAHSTEWRWNLGGPSSGGATNPGVAFHPLRSTQLASNIPSGSNSSPSRSTEWTWNLGGPWQPPPSASSQGPSSRSSQAGVVGARSGERARPVRSSGDPQTHRPWQRRRMLPDSSTEQEPTHQALTRGIEGSEISRAGSSQAGTGREADNRRQSQQGWRRLLPRFLGQMLPGGQPAREFSSSEGAGAVGASAREAHMDTSVQHHEADPLPSTSRSHGHAITDAGQYFCEPSL